MIKIAALLIRIEPNDYSVWFVRTKIHKKCVIFLKVEYFFSIAEPRDMLPFDRIDHWSVPRSVNDMGENSYMQ